MLYTRCITIAAGPDQCGVSEPPSAKQYNHLKPNINPKCLFSRVRSHFLHLGELDDEECHFTNKNVHGVICIQCRQSGYIHLLPCNIKSMTGKGATRCCAQTWIRGSDVSSEMIIDSGKECISEWCTELCTTL